MRSLRRLYHTTVRTFWFKLNRRRFTHKGVGRRPRLLIDVSILVRHDARTGIQRVVRAVYSELLRRRLPYDVVPVYASWRHGYCEGKLRPLAPQPPWLPRAVEVGPDDKFLGLDLVSNYLPSQIEQLRAWKAVGASIHMVVYDLLPLTKGEWFSDVSKQHFRRWFGAIVEISDQLLCISDTVLAEVASMIQGDVKRPALRRMQLSGEVSASEPSTGLTETGQAAVRRMRSNPSILMVGTVEPRKGYQVTLEALDLLWATDGDAAPDLVIVGRPGWKTDELQARIRAHPRIGKKLHWLDRVSDEELEQLYAASALVLVASRAEGFGLPLAEASSHGRWVLARDLPVFREQDLPNVLFFRDDDAQSLSASIQHACVVAAAKSPPVPQLKTWAECTDELLAVLQVN